MSRRQVPKHFVAVALTLLVLQGCILYHDAPSIRVKTIVSVQQALTAPSPASDLAQTIVPPTNCPHYPLGGFNDVWRHPEVHSRLGCAVAPSEAISGTAANLMGLYSRWLGEKRLFLVLFDRERRWRFIPDESGLPLDAPLMLWPAPERGNRGPAPESPTSGSPAPIITPAPTPTPGPGTPEAPTEIATPSPELTKTLLPPSPAQAVPRSTWPRGLFPASGRHEWLARAALPEEREVIWSSSAETPFNGALQEFEGGWLFWDGSTCFALFEDGTFTLCL